MEFDEWLEEFENIAQEHGVGFLVNSVGRDQLERYYDQGLTPEQALQEAGADV